MNASRRRRRSRILRPLVQFLKRYVTSRSWSAAQTAGRRLGVLYWHFGRRDRERTIAHLAIAFPDLSEDEREALAHRATLGQGTTFGEYLYLAEHGPDAAADYLDIKGWEHVVAARKEASVVLIATGHCGNWELLGPAFHRHGEKLTAIVRSLEDDWADAEMTRTRARLGSRIITRGEPGAARDLLALRRNGGYLAAFIDQDIRANSVFVPFFGRLAHTPVGPAQMAIRWSMAVVPAFCERLEDGRHVVRFQPRLATHQDEVELTAAITEAIEAQVRRRPEQWVWMHRRWRRKPPPADSSNA